MLSAVEIQEEAIKRVQRRMEAQDLNPIVIPLIPIKMDITKSKRKMGTYDRDTQTIYIYPENHDNHPELIDTILHEIAHYIVHKLYTHPLRPHGRAWKAIARIVGAHDMATSRTEHKYKVPKCYIT